MENALAAVRDKKMGYLKAAITYEVPRRTLFRLSHSFQIWLRLFLKRHSKNVSLRKPTGTSFARAKGFTQCQIGIL